jgi:large repetitive protein
MNSYAQSASQLVTVTPCRLVDTRTNGGPIQGGTSRTFNLPQLAIAGGCNSLATASAYSLNVTVVPQGRLGFLTIWPTGQPQPTVSLMNSLDGRIKANAVIVGGGTNQSVDVFVNNTTDVILDINAYFALPTSTTLAFYPLVPCRIVDTRTGNGGPLVANQERDFPLTTRECNIAGAAKAYSFNVTAVPIDNGRVGYLTVWPAGIPVPNVSTLNDPTGTVVANAAIVPSGPRNTVAAIANDNTNLLIDLNGYFAVPTPENPGLSVYTLPPCRALDTRPNEFTGLIVAPIVATPCGVPSSASGYILNATALPDGRLGYLTVWPDGEAQPPVSTLNALDGAFTSNMVIAAAAGLPADGSVDAFAEGGTTNLLLDVFGYLGGPSQLTITTTSLPSGTTGVAYNATLMAAGGTPPYTWTLSGGTTLPPGLALSDNGVISGTPQAAGSYQFTVQVQDTLNNVATQPLTITITAGSLTVTTTLLPGGSQNSPYNATLGAAGGTPPYTWSIASGALPVGLSLDPSTGNIAGTPTNQGVGNFTVQVTDSSQNTAQKALFITVGPPLTNTTLTGNYAFTFNGYSNGAPVFMAGNFVADGNGNLTSGELDLNSGAGGSQPSTFTGTYNLTLGSGLGTMTFNVGGTLGTLNFNLAISNLGNGTMIQDNADPAQRGSGSIFVQTPADFLIPPNSNYVIGTYGADQTLARYIKGSVIKVSSGGVVASGSEDINDNGTLSSRAINGGLFSPPDAHGRGQLSLQFPSGITNTYAYYVVYRGQFIVVGIDPLTDLDPLTMGSMLVQSGTFTNASLSGASVVEINGVNPNGGTPVADAQLGIFTASSGNASISLDENRGGTIIPPQISSGTYSVASNGRVTLTGFGGTPPIVYLSNSNQGFIVGQDASASSGVIEPQAGPPPYSNLSISGTYLGGTVTPVQSPVIDSVSFVFGDGNGNINGSENTSGPSGPGSNPISATYLVDSTGRAAVTGTPAGIMYVVSRKKIVLLPSGNNPALNIFVAGLTQ